MTAVWPFRRHRSSVAWCAGGNARGAGRPPGRVARAAADPTDGDAGGGHVRDHVPSRRASTSRRSPALVGPLGHFVAPDAAGGTFEVAARPAGRRTFPPPAGLVIPPSDGEPVRELAPTPTPAAPPGPTDAGLGAASRDAPTSGCARSDASSASSSGHGCGRDGGHGTESSARTDSTAHATGRAPRPADGRGTGPETGGSATAAGTGTGVASGCEPPAGRPTGERATRGGAGGDARGGGSAGPTVAVRMVRAPLPGRYATYGRGGGARPSRGSRRRRGRPPGRAPPTADHRAPPARRAGDRPGLAGGHFDAAPDLVGDRSRSPWPPLGDGTSHRQPSSAAPSVADATVAPLVADRGLLSRRHRSSRAQGQAGRHRLGRRQPERRAGVAPQRDHSRHLFGPGARPPSRRRRTRRRGPGCR